MQPCVNIVELSILLPHPSVCTLQQLIGTRALFVLFFDVYQSVVCHISGPVVPQ